MKNYRQPLILLGVLIALSLIAWGIASLRPYFPVQQPISDFETQVKTTLELSQSAYIGMEGHEGNFYLLDVHPYGPSEGGGYLSLIEQTPSGIEEIYKGQEAPPCVLMEANAVPTTLVPVCLDEKGAQITRQSN